MWKEEERFNQTMLRIGKHKNFKDTYYIRLGNWFLNFGRFIVIGRLKPNKVWFLKGLTKKQRKQNGDYNN